VIAAASGAFRRTLERMHLLKFCEIAVIGSFALATRLFVDFVLYERLARVPLSRVTSHRIAPSCSRW
jgi:hypothetical protein